MTRVAAGSSPPWASARVNEVILQVRVQPRARGQGIVGIIGDRLKLAVTAAPAAGRANAAVLAMIACLAEVPPSAVTVVRGASSRDKTIRIAAADPARILGRLRDAGACART